MLTLCLCGRNSVIMNLCAEVRKQIEFDTILFYDILYILARTFTHSDNPARWEYHQHFSGGHGLAVVTQRWQRTAPPHVVPSDSRARPDPIPRPESYGPALGELRASSEVNIHFIVLALEMAKENFSSATLSFFFCSPKQPTQTLCETRRGINMEINDTEIPSFPDATIIVSLILRLGPVPGKSTRWGDGEESRTPVSTNGKPLHAYSDFQHCASLRQVLSTH